jgi:4-hydroxy-tetrahydrodipicolinate synthase
MLAWAGFHGQGLIVDNQQSAGDAGGAAAEGALRRQAFRQMSPDSVPDRSQDRRGGTGLPAGNAVVAAVATPVTPDYRPDLALLAEHCRRLLAEGCDGIALFGTTGEGGEFAVEDRQQALATLAAGGIAPARLIVSAGALTLPDATALASHATAHGAAGVLLMPPPLYRSGIGEDGTFRFYATVIDRVAREDLRLYLYHFPDICGVPITAGVIRRLSDRYGPIIAGVKDSGGDLGVTEDLLRRFSHLAVYTGTEIHLPAVLGNGGAGTICGLANVVAPLMRRMSDARTLDDRRRFIPRLQAVDSILSRGPFIPSLKAAIADRTGEPAWRRVVPPKTELPLADEQRLLADFRRLQEGMPL